MYIIGTSLFTVSLTVDAMIGFGPFKFIVFPQGIRFISVPNIVMSVTQEFIDRHLMRAGAFADVTGMTAVKSTVVFLIGPHQSRIPGC